MTGTQPSTEPVHIVGAGLAGSEAAWQVATSGVPVVLHEMRPRRMTEAHRTDGFAELVCSNSFRSDDAANNAVGLLHAEMRRLGSLIMRAADANQVPAGGALAVDRDGFSAAVTKALQDHPLIEIRRATEADVPAFLDVMSVSFGVQNRAPTVHTWVAGQPGGFLLVAEDGDGRVVATGAGMGFGPTGWIGWRGPPSRPTTARRWRA